MQSSNLSDNFEFIDSNLLNPDFPFYFSSLDTFPELPPSDLFNYTEFETIDSSNFCQFFDQNFQNYTKDYIKFFPDPLDGAYPCESVKKNDDTKNIYQNITKIGTCTTEERRQKVQKYLEKRKRRVYTKKISYLCRKRVADKRERCKGRFVSKKTELSKGSESPSEV
ncbi:hypothetical protein SteCoe_20932 [Stentor coeruleus]|uniref:CCT domain-containing protein n=1 Tax=Stentor coeruleus TaxID=5963 RepID=A0A1R2BQX7_9CILI|nr:hypothetical protein SteCoe_20932 [Stentor coeruleus]